MFWDKKDDKNRLPDLAPPKTNAPIGGPLFESISSPSLKNLPKDDLDEDKMPSFPEMPEEHQEEKEEFPLPKIPDYQNNLEKKFKTVEIPENHKPAQMIREIKQREPKPLNLGAPPAPQQFHEIPQKHPEKLDIFVKIDKFRTARKSLSEIKLKIEEVESLLRRIRETKMREEHELASWETELNDIKAKIKDITQNIFEKAE